MPFLKYLVLLLAPALFSTAVLSYLISDSTSKHADPDTQSCHATDGVGLNVAVLTEFSNINGGFNCPEFGL